MLTSAGKTSWTWSLRNQERGGVRLAVVGDVTGRAHASREAVAAAKAFGGLYIAFNNAGLVGAMKPLAEIEP